MQKIFLLTGLSGAGKTTLARALHAKMKDDLCCAVLDGDEMRHGICRDLGFSRTDRHENMRRCGEIAKNLASQGICVLMAMIAPYEESRRLLEQMVGKDTLRIVHISCPVEVCIARDPKNNYRKALAGILKNYTGIGDAYEPPASPDFVLETGLMPVEASVELLHKYMLSQLLEK